MAMQMRTADFDFPLPDERIARHPAERRDASRLMHLPWREGPPRDLRFSDLPTLLAPGDLLVRNDTRVIPARLLGRKAETGGKVEVLLCDPLPPGEGGARWRCMAASSKALRPGIRLAFGEGDVLGAEVEEAGEGFAHLRFDVAHDALFDWLDRLGELPLPPYLRRREEASDRQRYQTIYAREPGAVAAPTAGLHFTEEIFAALERRGVRTCSLTLHVGPGTFLPVRAEHLEDHRMHAERYVIPEESAEAIARTREEGGRIVAVGTTSLRALESATDADGVLRAGPGSSELFITPGYDFRCVDGLLTNFHLPRSTLVMLVAALTGRERLLSAYAHAVDAGYRFYSYGDAMLVL